jgi:hypothetical protein
VNPYRYPCRNPLRLNSRGDLGKSLATSTIPSIPNTTQHRKETLTFLSFFTKIVDRLVHIEEVVPQRLADAVVRYRRLKVCEKWFGDAERQCERGYEAQQLMLASSRNEG